MEHTKCKILFVEDDRLDRMAFERFVENEKLPYDYTTAGSISEAKSILDSEQFDIIVSDYSLGDGTALDILNSVKNIPIILITGAADEEVAIKAWKAGAYDYLPKDLNRNYLNAVPRTIENAIKRKKVEDALERKQKNLEAIFDAAPVGMLLADENVIVTHANDTIRQMCHREYSQIINQQIGGALGCVNSTYNEKGCGYGPACAGCLLKNAIKSVLDFGQSVRGVEMHPTLEIDNKKIAFWLRISVEPTIIDGRRHVIAAIDDITDRKKAEDERRLAEEKYRTIFENSAVAITMVDEQERLISWNKFMERLLGMDEEDLYLRPVRSFYPVQEWERIRACDVRQKGMQHHLETKMIKKDGRVIDVDISLSVLKDSEGKTTGSIGVIRDITERRKAEEKLKETMEFKSQFISTVSHELRTPLAAMTEGLGLVLDEVVGKINEKQRKFLDIAKRNADRLSDLINDVLDFQKLEAGRMKLDVQSNDIEKLLSEVQDTMTLHAKKNQVELLFTSSEDLPRATFDRAKVIQVLTNLVSNAIKFTPEKGRVSVNVQYQNEDWVVSVSDTGMGIPKEALPKIFERFYRVKRRGKQIQGTGLGLAIVHKLVMMHGGRIEVESEVDQGTTFTVFLPLDSKASPGGSSEKTDEFLENAVAEAR
ncbi:MAG: PAS domain-containing sensor histidine kinase [Planctomycetota bacterium]|jgi:PAS domain S-box-containing protein